MLAQVSLGLLLFERREQESRAKLQNGEISHKLQLHEKAITVIYWTVISSRGFFNNSNFQLINYITNVFVIIYLGLVIPPNFGVYENTSLAYCPQTLNFRSYTICFKTLPVISKQETSLKNVLPTYLFFGATQPVQD